MGADRPRPLRLLRAGGARHLRLFRLGASRGARPRAGERPLDPGWRPRTADRRPFPRARAWETTLAQVAHEILGVPVARTRLVHGDTAMTPFSTGSWGSRVVMAGGAVAAACEGVAGPRRANRRPPASSEPGRLPVRGRPCGAALGDVPLETIARTWYRRPQDSLPRHRSGGLEVTAGYKPVRDPAPSPTRRTRPWWRPIPISARGDPDYVHRRGLAARW